MLPKSEVNLLSVVLNKITALESKLSEEIVDLKKHRCEKTDTVSTTNNKISYAAAVTGHDVNKTLVIQAKNGNKTQAKTIREEVKMYINPTELELSV